MSAEHIPGQEEQVQETKCPICGSQDLKSTPWAAGPDYLCNQCGCHFDMFEDGPGAIL